MRRQLIEALIYPRLLVLKLIEGGHCPYDSLYDATGERCKNCGPKGDCNWVRCLQDFRQFDTKPTEVLSTSLREGIRLVESLHSELRHDETSCRCETCIWIRNAEHLTEECELHLPHLDPATSLQMH